MNCLSKVVVVVSAFSSCLLELEVPEKCVQLVTTAAAGLRPRAPPPPPGKRALHPEPDAKLYSCPAA